jgi:hypothetical protein
MGCESGSMKLCGAPATSESCTLFQSEPTVLSTTAHPWRSACRTGVVDVASPDSEITIR